MTQFNPFAVGIFLKRKNLPSTFDVKVVLNEDQKPETGSEQGIFCEISASSTFVDHLPVLNLIH